MTQYLIWEGSYNAKVLQLIEQHEVPKFENSLTHKKIAKSFL